MTGSNVSNSNYLCYGLGTTTNTTAIAQTYGRFNNVRA